MNICTTSDNDVAKFEVANEAGKATHIYIKILTTMIIYGKNNLQLVGLNALYGTIKL